MKNGNTSSPREFAVLPTICESKQRAKITAELFVVRPMCDFTTDTAEEATIEDASKERQSTNIRHSVG